MHSEASDSLFRVIRHSLRIAEEQGDDPVCLIALRPNGDIRLYWAGLPFEVIEMLRQKIVVQMSEERSFTVKAIPFGGA